MTLRLTAVLGVFCVALAAAGAGVATPATVTPVMINLDNPRGLAFDKKGALFVAEAGRGGAGPCQVLRPADLGGAPSCGARTPLFGRRRPATSGDSSGTWCEQS